MVEQLHERFPQAAALLAEGWPGHPCFHRLHRRPLAADLVQQSAGAAEQGDQAPHRRGGHLPQQDGDQAAHWGRPPQAKHDEWATSRRYLSVGGSAGEEVTTGGFLERKEAALLPVASR